MGSKQKRSRKGTASAGENLLQDSPSKCSLPCPGNKKRRRRRNRGAPERLCGSRGILHPEKPFLVYPEDSELCS